jgi:branched-chain amino acid transport system ATP-binding protein
VAEPVLGVEGLSKHFGGLAAVSDVSLDLHQGAIHAVIGPNGAGKTTLLNLLSGELTPSSGRVRHEGREIAGLSPERIARLGIARSYQKSNIFGAFTVFENCRLAAQAALAPGLRCFRPSTPRPRAHLPRSASRDAAKLSPRRSLTASSASSSSPWCWQRRPRCCCSTSRSPAWAPRRARA